MDTPTPLLTKSAKIAAIAATILTVIYAAWILADTGRLSLIGLPVSWISYFVVAFALSAIVIGASRKLRSS
jgi:hypothetical protein